MCIPTCISYGMQMNHFHVEASGEAERCGEKKDYGMRSSNVSSVSRGVSR